LSGKWEEGRKILHSANESFLSEYEVIQNNVTIPGEEEHVIRIKSAYGFYRGLWERPIVGTVHENNLQWYFQELHPAFMGAKLAVEGLISMNDSTMYKTASSLKNRGHRAVMPGIVTIIAALAFTLVFNYFVNYYVVNPIVRLTRGIQEHILTGAKLDVEVETTDELFDLTGSIKTLMSQNRRE
jgi:HAMP domain-containing protein